MPERWTEEKMEKDFQTFAKRILRNELSTFDIHLLVRLVAIKHKSNEFTDNVFDYFGADLLDEKL